MIRLTISAMLAVLLVACGADVPRAFADPAAERERLEDELDASCKEERTGYWFCTAENGFFHIFVVGGTGGNRVKTVMLDRNSEPGMQAQVAGLYGFSAGQLAAVREMDEERIVEGGFVLKLDPTWNEPIIEIHTPEEGDEPKDGE